MVTNERTMRIEPGIAERQRSRVKWSRRQRVKRVFEQTCIRSPEANDREFIKISQCITVHVERDGVHDAYLCVNDLTSFMNVRCNSFNSNVNSSTFLPRPANDGVDS